LLLYPL